MNILAPGFSKVTVSTLFSKFAFLFFSSWSEWPYQFLLFTWTVSTLAVCIYCHLPPWSLEFLSQSVALFLIFPVFLGFFSMLWILCFLHNFIMISLLMFNSQTLKLCICWTCSLISSNCRVTRVVPTLKKLCKKCSRKGIRKGKRGNVLVWVRVHLRNVCMVKEKMNCAVWYVHERKLQKYTKRNFNTGQQKEL